MSDSEADKALQMLSGSDFLALEGAFLELQKSKWSFLNGFGKLTSRAFQKYLIVHTLLQNQWPKTGVQRQPSTPVLVSNAQRRVASVQCL